MPFWCFKLGFLPFDICYGIFNTCTHKNSVKIGTWSYCVFLDSPTATAFFLTHFFTEKQGLKTNFWFFIFLLPPLPKWDLLLHVLFSICSWIFHSCLKKKEKIPIVIHSHSLQPVHPPLIFLSRSGGVFIKTSQHKDLKMTSPTLSTLPCTVTSSSSTLTSLECHKMN